MITKANSRYNFIKEIKQYNTSREHKDYYGKEALKNNMIYYGRAGFCGNFALSLAIAEGYDEIYLLGYDFGVPKVEQTFTHYYQDKLKVKSGGVGNPVVYFNKDNKVKDEVNDFKIYLQEKVNIYNCSLISNIPFFIKLGWETFFNKLNNSGVE